MSFRFALVPEARKDILNAKDWYESESFGLGDRFAHAVDQAVDFIQEYPLARPIVFEDYHFMITKTFPFCLYYTVDSSEIIIYAVLHGKQDRERILAERIRGCELERRGDMRKWK